ncbi:hypothetical protein [Hydrogenophaga palleronii]|uniref:hypothetical protein n=1 Tax=Hydrogenophaga palleronii TaxID=65655 RepID=UPI000A57A199|nr:hypothetical protein [Hydrogenophaga palleronii]
MKHMQRHNTIRLAASAGLVALCLVDIGAAHAWNLDVVAGSRRLFLHVGNGALSGSGNGTLDAAVGRSGPVNLVQVTVPATAVGTGAAQPMTSNSTQSNSLWADGYLVCPDPSRQMLVGAGYRIASGATTSASLSVAQTTPLTNTATTDTIPFSQISWTVSAAGSSVPGVIPAGTFTGASQTLATVPANRYFENCHTFSYANSAVRAAGTYNGGVTYTLSAP